MRNDTPPPPVSPDDIPMGAWDAVRAYRDHFAGPNDSRPVTVAWAPGRVNLIGEHTDYNDGWALPVAVDRVVAVAGRPHARENTILYSVHHDQRRTLHHDDAATGAVISGGPLWLRLARSVHLEVAREAGVQVASLPCYSAAVAGDVPVGGGMSSSAAYEVALATFLAALGGPAFAPMTTARLCQRAEQIGAGVQIGVMDQATSCLGRAGHALLLDCRSLACEYIPVRLPGVALAVFDTRVSRSLAATGYNERRAQCAEAVGLLRIAVSAEEPERQIHSLRDVTPTDLARYGNALPDVLLRRARHVVGENERVLDAVVALREGDGEQLGRLLYASHSSLRDDYEVSCGELNAAVEIAATVPGVLGARMMGAGFGGSALILARDEARAALDAILVREYEKTTRRAGVLHICHIHGGPESRII